MICIKDENLKKESSDKKLNFDEILNKIEIIKRSDKRDHERKVHNCNKLGELAGLSII
jgi:hypothetical protein